MKSRFFTLAALSAFSLFANARVVHLDVSDGGDVSVDIDLNQKPSARASRGSTDRPAYSPKQSARVLKDYQVDLDYEIHQGFLMGDKTKYVNFSNIPYAETTEGEGRWAPPLRPYGDPNTVNDGSKMRICPQMQAGWVPTALDFLADYGSSEDLPDRWEDKITAGDYGDMPEQDERGSEDCLTLDVMVPQKVWDARNSRRMGAAVVVWIFGGGYIFGWKDQAGSPAGLIEVGNNEPEDNVIHVAINYRLGAFGWLGGPKFQQEGGLPNTGLLDQGEALKWVRDYIYLFGGAASRITVMGQSAGASSIMHHITLNAGQRNPPVFQKAILQSPAFFPTQSDKILDETYTEFLRLTDAKDLDDLLSKDTNTLMRANAEMTFKSQYGLFAFGPTVDGVGGYVPELPGKLLKKDQFHKGIAILLGKVKSDGLLFTPPWVRTNADIKDHIREIYPTITDGILNSIIARYPPVALNPGPKEQIYRFSDLLDDVACDCNLQYLTEATLRSSARTPKPVYRYVFNAIPGIHGTDVNYTFYPQQDTTGNPFPPDPKLANFWQSSMLDFARYYDPNPEDSSFWKEYRTDARQVMNFANPDMTSGDFNSSMGTDVQWALKQGNCAFWQDAPYYGNSPNKVGLVKQGDGYKEYL